MWKLNDICAENICSFSNLHYTLNQGVTTLVFGNNLDNDSQRSNGSGKSALIECIALGIIGAPLRKVKNEEIINDEADECRIYLGNGRAKPRISWSIEKEQAYGDYAYMIRLKWIDHQSDRIHSSHIWLKNSQNGRKYSFLTEYIAPENGREEDCYIIEILPGRANPNTLVIEGDEILLEKYAIVR